MLRVDCRSFLCIDTEEVGIECLDVLLQRVGTVHVDASMAFSVGVEEAFRVEAAGINLFQCVTLLNEQIPKLRGTARTARKRQPLPTSAMGSGVTMLADMLIMGEKYMDVSGLRIY